MKMTLLIPGKLPGLNQIIGAINTNRFAGHSLKKKWQSYVEQQILIQKLSRFVEPVTISFDWIEPDARRDIDNVSSGGRKYILDALVAMNVLPDDSRKWVKRFTDSFPPPDKENPHIRVVIQSVMRVDLGASTSYEDIASKDRAPSVP